MSKKIPLLSCLTSIIAAGCLIVIFALSGIWMYLRPQPAGTTTELFTGVTYQRESRTSPRPIVLHVVRVNLRAEGIGILVTPGDPELELPLQARTTSEFLEEFNLQIAINGDGFTPWYSRGVFDYYPHSGDPVDVIGAAISGGILYSSPTDAEPTLYFSQTNQARIGVSPGKTAQAISGNQTLVQQGRALKNLDELPQPRTAVGLNQRRNELIMVVIDGRQPGYSEGVTLEELAEILVSLGAFEAINLDGGGSSTMVMENSGGNPRILNTPINQGIPGRQRPVGNHLGIYAAP
jgi:hypothetical protein